MERILLFLFAVVGAGFIVAGIVTLSTDQRSGWLFLLGAVFLIGLAWRSWRRLATSVRQGAVGEGRKPDA